LAKRVVTKVVFFPVGLVWLFSCGFISRLKSNWRWDQVKLNSTMGQFLPLGILQKWLGIVLVCVFSVKKCTVVLLELSTVWYAALQKGGEQNEHLPSKLGVGGGKNLPRRHNTWVAREKKWADLAAPDMFAKLRSSDMR